MSDRTYSFRQSADGPRAVHPPLLRSVHQYNLVALVFREATRRLVQCRADDPDGSGQPWALTAGLLLVLAWGSFLKCSIDNSGRTSVVEPMLRQVSL